MIGLTRGLNPADSRGAHSSVISPLPHQFKKFEPNRNAIRRCILCVMAVIAAASLLSTASDAAPRAAASTTIFSENWESGIGDWFAEAGVWQVGAPTSGPGAAHGGTQCAATVLAGNYPNGANSRLIGPEIALPASPQDGRLTLRFWHWFSVNSPGDSLTVEISVAFGPWVPITRAFATYGGAWTQDLVDLSAYANSSVRLAFRIQDNGDGGEAVGWYVDDLSIDDGNPPDWSPETFESGNGAWYAENGAWEIGVPAAGPGSGHAGPTHCAGTVLAGNYPRDVDSRLISPSIALPAPVDGVLTLRFWHWFSLNSTSDSLYVEISEAGGPWQRLSRSFGPTGGGWTQQLIDISSYAGQDVRIAFRIRDNGDGGEGTGWYVDDVDLVQGRLRWAPPEGFESFRPRPGIGGWYAENGVWQVEEPVAGPGSAYEGSLCAATVAAGNYPRAADSRLISPGITLPAAPAAGLWLSFWHWFSLYNSGDSIYVEVSAEGGDWQRITEPFGAAGAPFSGGWTHYATDVSAFAGHSIRLAFRIRDNNDGGEATGWYVDQVGIAPGQLVFNNPEGFENGHRDWYASDGQWQCGPPIGGPGSAHSGTSCAGTVLGGNYAMGSDSRLVSPDIPLPTSPPGGILRLRFYHWFSFYNTLDSALVEMSVAHGPWLRLGSFTGSSGGWTQYIAPSVIASAGQSVRLAFRIKDNNDGGQAAGWYVDDVRLEGYSEATVGSPTFTFDEYSGAGAPVLTWVNPVGSIGTNIYAGADADFVPDLSNRVSQVTGTTFTDTARPGAIFHYKIAAIDALLHESLPVGPLGWSGVEAGTGSFTPSVSCAPNPFHDRTRIDFIVTRGERVRVQVFAVTGRLVATALDGLLETGPHSVTLDAAGLDPGIYWVRVSQGARVVTGKVVRLK